jgi:CHAT domain-containing protein
MASRTYQNFDLLLEAAEDGVFRARVTTSPQGECPSGKFTLPFDATQLENLLLKLDPGRSGTRRAGSDPQSQASMDLGGPLFEAVFSEDIMLAWQRSQDFARDEGDGLRLRLRLTDAPAIAGLPWELLYDRRGNSFIAQSERTPVVRYLEVPQPPRPLAVDGALRILVVISSPTDLPELDVEAEWRRVQDALATKVAEGTVKIDRLPAPTIQALSAWLRQNDVHILHFIGHGDYDERIQDGVIYFQDRYGRSTKVSPTVLGPYLRDHDPLRLVLLNACQSARVDSTDPFSGMAQGLVQQDCTAVVAMQFPISDGAATAFTGEFYGALADGFPVDQAATSARKALIAEYAAEWATPVLFLRAPDGRVFDHIVAQPAVTAVPTPAPEVEDEDEQRARAALATDATTTVTTRKPDAEPAEPDEKAATAAAVGLRGAASSTQPLPTTPAPSHGPMPVPTTEPTTEPSQPAYQPPVYAAPQPPTYSPPQQPAYQARPQPAPPNQQPPRYVDPPPKPRKPRWGLIITVILAVVTLVLGGLYWYGRSLPERVDPTNNNGGQASTLTGPKISATHLSTGLTIDADPTDWPNDIPTFDSNVLIAGNDTGLLGHWALAWDDKALYAMVAVTDKTALQTHASDTSQLFKGDGVSFEFGTAVPKNDNASLEAGDKHVMFGPANFKDNSVIGGINVPDGAVFTRGTNTIQGLKAATVKTDDGYLIEAAIPWSTLGVDAISGGAEFGMNLNVSDSIASGAKAGELSSFVSNNPGRKGNDAQFRSVWGTLQLEG